MQLPSEKATQIVAQRRTVYGHPYENFRRLAPMIDVILDLPLGTVTPMQAVMIQVALKQCREMSAGYRVDYEDNVDDMAGYSNVLALVKERHEELRRDAGGAQGMEREKLPEPDAGAGPAGDERGAGGTLSRGVEALTGHPTDRPGVGRRQGD